MQHLLFQFSSALLNLGISNYRMKSFFFEGQFCQTGLTSKEVHIAYGDSPSASQDMRPNQYFKDKINQKL